MNRSYLFVFLILTFNCAFLSCNKSDSVVQPGTTPDPPIDTTPQKKWIVSTFAGSGQRGSADGDSTAAQFYAPTDIAFDSEGNLFLADLLNFNIRKITPAGEVTTYAGRSIYDPPGFEFGNIYGLTMDHMDHLYVIDYDFIRKISSPTQSSIFAGNWEISFKDGPDTSARFNTIAHMAVDQNNNIYVPCYDMENNFRIRKVDLAGVVTTLSITDNTGFPSKGGPDVWYLSAIAVDNENNIYVTANGNCLIKKITPQGIATVFAGAGNIGFTDGKGTSAQFNSIAGLATDALGNVFVADYGNNAIRKITPDGTVTTIAGGTQGFENGEGTKAQFFYPFGIAIDKNGVVFVSEFGNNTIRKIEYK